MESGLIEGSKNPRNRNNFIYVSIIVALSLLGDALLYAVLPGRTSAFRVLLWQVGIILSANRVVRLVTNEIAGRILERYGSKKPLLVAVIVGAFTTAGYGVPLGFVWLVFLRLIWGACWSVFRAEGYLTAFNFSSDSNRGKIVGIYESITRAGSGIGVLFGGFLVDMLGVSPVFFIYGFVTLLGILFLFLASGGGNGEVFPGLSDERAPSGEARTHPNLHSLRKSFYVYYSVMVAVMVEQMIVNLTGRVVADNIVSGISVAIGVASLTGVLLGFRTFGNLVLSPVFGHLSDRVGRHKIIIIMTFMEIFSLIFLFFLRGSIVTVLLLVLFFLFAIAGRLAIYAVAGDITQAQKSSGERAIYMSRFVTFADIGMSAGPLVAFSLYSLVGLKLVSVVGVFFLLPLVYLWLSRRDFLSP